MNPSSAPSIVTHLQTALALFTEHGFRGLSMDQLVAAAGGSKATLYRYFSSKEQLFEAIIADLQETTMASRSVDELAGLGLEEGLRSIGHATARAALSEQATVLFRLAAGEFSRFPGLAQVMFERDPAVAYARLCDFLAHESTPARSSSTTSRSPPSSSSAASSATNSSPSARPGPDGRERDHGAR